MIKKVLSTKKLILKIALKNLSNSDNTLKNYQNGEKYTLRNTSVNFIKYFIFSKVTEFQNIRDFFQYSKY